ARLNEQRRRAGLGRLGFAQPLLYRLAERTPHALRSVLEGDTDMVVPALDALGAVVPFRVPGYRTCQGWSPATGLGIPDGTALARALHKASPVRAHETRTSRTAERAHIATENPRNRDACTAARILDCPDARGE